MSKDYPEFYRNYLVKFERKSDRFVALNLEISGPDPHKDVILSIGAIGIENNNVVVNDLFEVVLLQYKFLHDNDLSNEFIIESKQPKLGEREALQAFINFIGNAVLVGHRIHLDVDILNATLERMDCGRIRNEAIDIEIMHRKLLDTDKSFSLNELNAHYKIVPADRISTAEDAYNVALLFLALKLKLGLQ